MNPALLAAINKGGGKAPSKMAGKDKVKMKKKPPVRPDQKYIENDCKLKFKFTPSASGIQKERLVKRIQYIEK